MAVRLSPAHRTTPPQNQRASLDVEAQGDRFPVSNPIREKRTKTPRAKVVERPGSLQGGFCPDAKADGEGDPRISSPTSFLDLRCRCDSADFREHLPHHVEEILPSHWLL